MNQSNLLQSSFDRSVIFILRIMMGWTFLYAGIWQIWQNYDIAGFLNSVVTFHDLYAVFAKPAVLPVTNFLVKWGHLLIGLSLVSGLLVRVSGPFAVLLMIVYYFAHMEFPYVEGHYNFIVESSRLCDRDRFPHRPPLRSRLGPRRFRRAPARNRTPAGTAAAVRLMRDAG